MNRRFLFHQKVLSAIIFSLVACLSSADEWKPRHDLVSHTGVMNLAEPPQPGGGAAYHPLGSIWYFPQTYRLDEHQKYLLMSPGRDRAGTIGFRCAVDAR